MARLMQLKQVNAANKRMLGGGGVDGAIHRAAGPELLAACRAIPEVEPDVRCPTGSARITKAFKLLVSHVIYTVGPVYESDEDPPNALSNAYKNSVMVAKENNIKYIAFPAISCGIYRYPPEAAAQVALSTLQEHTADLKEPLELRLSEQFLILPLDHHSNLSSLASTSASTLIPKRIVSNQSCEDTSKGYCFLESLIESRSSVSWSAKYMERAWFQIISSLKLLHS
ncbi:uncharacterized protein LOC131047046 isoform X6 [Cryptomeria japonica]|uniref:uncharacterized protein LOC131047046 isoform X6 n=1 Tax=Cryptomeria japonica TaxID=3369 RepID=UPI0027DA7D0F|nr:uncharacterized protein LOC131047046 isoform X6 [Cryptomeria japonica]